MAPTGQLLFESLDEHAEVGVAGPRVHLRDEQDPHYARLGVVRPDTPRADLADLPHRAPQPQRLPHRKQQVLVRARDPPDLFQRPRSGLGVPLGSDALRPLQLPPLRLRIEPVELDRLLLVLLVAVDTDDDALALLDLALVAERRVLDLALDEALLDRRNRAADLVDPLDQLPRRLLELRRQRLDEVGAAEGSACPCRPPPGRGPAAS